MTAEATRPLRGRRKIVSRGVIRHPSSASTTSMSSAARAVRLFVSGAFAEQMVGPLRSGLVSVGCTVDVTSAKDPVSAAADADGPQTDDPQATASLGILLADQDDPVVAGFSQTWRAAGMPSLVVIQQHPEVRIGPLDVPDTALCARCFQTRARQHGRLAEAGGEKLSDCGAAVSVDGYPPYVIALVVALVVDRIAVLDETSQQRNEVTLINTATLATCTAPVVPVNRCPRCDDQKPVGLLAGHRPMFQELERLPR
jgi:bacteriocin biosynthesis cyclodehydratase domain-containing protein